MEKRKIYFIADNHWGHKSIIKLCNREFTDTHHMNMSMIESWNKVVQPNDIVYHLGDLMYKMNSKQFRDLILAKLNGEIRLIQGNHDKPKTIQAISGRIKFVKDYYEFDYEGFKFCLNHKPIKDWTNTENIIHIFGHIHNNPIGFDIPVRNICVSVELINYTPISIDEILEK